MPSIGRQQAYAAALTAPADRDFGAWFMAQQQKDKQAERAKGRVLDAMPNPMGQSLTAPTPTRQSVLSDLLRYGLEGVGMGGQKAAQAGDFATSLTPVAALDDLDRGDPRAALESAVGGPELAVLGAMAGKGVKASDELAQAFAKTKTFNHPISGVKLRTPIEEMEATYKPFGEMRPKKLLHPEWLLDKKVLLMRGDPAMAGQTLTELGGRKLETPVDLHGGEGYPRMMENVEKGIGWATNPSPASTQGNKAAGIFKETGKPAVGVYQKMGERSTAYNTMLSETLLQDFKLGRSKISNADVAEFDRIMREVPLKIKKNGKADRPAYPDWPGLDNLTPEYIRKGGGANGDGKVRNKMFDLMDSKYWQDRGMPNTGYANYATTDRELFDTPTHTIGGATVTFDPLGRTVDDINHPTYSRGIMAKEEGVLPNIPLDVMDPNYRLTGGTNGGPIPNQYLEKFLSTKPPSVLVDRQTLDRVMKYLRTQDGSKWGLGGAVAAGLISEEQAREMAQGQGTGAAQ